MKFSLGWLQRYLDTNLSAEALSEKLTSLGLEIDEVEDTSVGPAFILELTPDRVDCAGVYGVARDLAAAGCGTLKPVEPCTIPGSYVSPIGVKLAFDAEHANACPYFIGRHIKNVKNCESPTWLKDLLTSAGLKPISALVDITNYFSIGMCRPLHVFDAAKLSGDITVRLARNGEKMVGLDENEYTLDDSMTVIADESGPQALAGILGGLASGCSMDTTDVFLEVAYFDPIRTAFTGRSTKIISDARYRFERGVDPAFLPAATELATELILELCGGSVSENVIAGSEPTWKRAITFSPARVKSLGGLDVPTTQQEAILSSLGCSIDSTSTPWTVTPPSWRPDIHGSADLVEEVIRVIGYDEVPATPLFPVQPLSTKAKLSVANTRLFDLHHLFAGRGMLGTVTWSFMLDAHARCFSEQNENLFLMNPISAELNYLRPSILPNLVLAAKRNADRSQHNAAFFEIGPAFSFTKTIEQETVATGLRTGSNHERHWNSTVRPVDVYDAKADIVAALKAIGICEASLSLSSDGPSYFHPGACGIYTLEGTPVAYFGELHPAVLKELDLDAPAAGFELFLDRLPKESLLPTSRKALSARPLVPVERDFAFLVDNTLTANTLVAAILQSGTTEISSARVFDHYQGKGIPEGKKSLAVVVSLQPQDKAFTEEDLERISGSVVKSVQEKTGGELR